MKMKTLIKGGESLTLGISIVTALTIRSVVVRIGEKIFSSDDDTLLQDGNVYKIALKSSDTMQMIGSQSIIVAIDTEEAGVKKTDENAYILQVVESSNGFSNAATSEVVNATLEIEITSNSISSNLVLANIYRGFSAYELAVIGGFEGTLEDWLNKQNEAVEAATQANASRAEAVEAATQANASRAEAVEAATTITNLAICFTLFTGTPLPTQGNAQTLYLTNNSLQKWSGNGYAAVDFAEDLNAYYVLNYAKLQQCLEGGFFTRMKQIIVFFDETWGGANMYFFNGIEVVQNFTF